MQLQIEWKVWIKITVLPEVRKDISHSAAMPLKGRLTAFTWRCNPCHILMILIPVSRREQWT